MRLANEQRQNIEDVRNLLIPTANGSQVPLYQLADVSIKQSVNQIQRDDAKRRIIVGFNVNGRDVESVVKDLQASAQKINLPTGYYITYGGAFENLQAAQDRLKLAVPISLLLIFIFLYFAFNSIKHGLIIYSAIPLSAIGGILFLAMRGMPFSISAGVGFIALFGVAVLNGIVLIAEFNRLKNEYPNDLQQVVMHGTKHRLRPVLMTAFVASLGFLPMALSHGAGAEVQRPLATVVIGGLLIATLLTLFVIPILYMLFENYNSKNKVPKNAVTVFVVLMLTIVSNQKVYSQSTITLQGAIDSAMLNNSMLKTAGLNAVYQKKLIGTSLDIDNTTLNAQIGQYNSSYTDNAFSISQSFKFPTVYAKQKLVQKGIYEESQADVALKEAQIKKEISNVYYQLIYLQQQYELLQEADSLFASATQKAKLRFETGETDLLHYKDAELQRGQINLQLQELAIERNTILSKFNLLINCHQTYTPDYETGNNTINFAEIKTATDNHPQLSLYRNQLQTAQRKIQLEKNNLLPQLHFGYNTTTIRGTGADNLFYSGNTRFNSMQFGLGVPLFFKNQQSKIRAAKIQQLQYQEQFDFEKTALNAQLNACIDNYKFIYAKVNYFEKNALANNEQLTSNANKKFAAGEINYIEWAMLIHHAIEIRSNYTDACYELNRCINELNYLTTK